MQPYLQLAVCIRDMTHVDVAHQHENVAFNMREYSRTQAPLYTYMVPPSVYCHTFHLLFSHTNTTAGQKLTWPMYMKHMWHDSSTLEFLYAATTFIYMSHMNESCYRHDPCIWNICDMNQPYENSWMQPPPSYKWVMSQTWPMYMKHMWHDSTIWEFLDAATTFI